VVLEWWSGVGGGEENDESHFIRSVGVVELERSVVEFWEADLVWREDEGTVLVERREGGS
jgi:hypothetical protein